MDFFVKGSDVLVSGWDIGFNGGNNNVAKLCSRVCMCVCVCVCVCTRVHAHSFFLVLHTV
jgi:hypothetical protein